jgi:hypothetical protein
VAAVPSGLSLTPLIIIIIIIIIISASWTIETVVQVGSWTQAGWTHWKVSKVNECLIYLSIYLSVYLSIHLSIYGSTALVDLGRFFSFFIYTQLLWLLGRGISPSQGRYLHTEQHKKENKCIQTSMPRVRFEPKIPVFERSKTVHALECAATEIGECFIVLYVCILY